MKNVHAIMGITCLSFGMITVAAQQQIFDVSICVIDSDKYFRRDDNMGLEKYKHFGMKKPLPFDKYFPVQAAWYTDRFDNVGCIELQQDLLKNIPQIIENDLGEFSGKNILKLTEKNMLKLTEKYKFPKFVSQSFITRVEEGQKSNQPVMHTIYENDTKIVKLRYFIQHLQKQQSTALPVEQVSESCSKSLIDDSYSVDFSFLVLSLLAMTN